MSLSAVQLATIAAVAAAVIPLVVSLLKQEHWSAAVKQAIALAASFACAAVGIAVTVTDWSAINWATLIGLSYTGSQVVYQVYFRGSAFDATLTGLHAPKPKPVVAPTEPSTPVPAA